MHTTGHPSPTGGRRTGPADITARGYGWRHAGRKAPALADIDLAVPGGQRVLLVGASGSGKSTLLHALTGVLPADSGHRTGELLVDGRRPDPARGRSGLVLQDPESQVILARAGDDAAFGMENLGVDPADIWPRVDAVLRIVGLGPGGRTGTRGSGGPGAGSVPVGGAGAGDAGPAGSDDPADFADPAGFADPTGLARDTAVRAARARLTRTLSGGQKQRLALAGVLAMEPGLIALDEPTANIDPASAPVLRDAVLRAQVVTGATLLVVDHRVDLWCDHVDRVVVLDSARIVADGTPDLLIDPGLRELLRTAGVRIPGTPPPPARPPGAGGEPLLSAHGLAVTRPGRTEPVAAGIDLELRAGTATALVGPNGAGKSTTALTLGGLLRPAAGEVRASDALLRAHRPVPRRRQPDAWRSRELVTRIGSVFQEPEHQFLTDSVEAELAFGLQRARLPAARIRERVAELLGVLRLAHLARAHPHTLSGGEKRRLSVACMIACSPPLLVLDEPTFGQDAATWEGLRRLLGAELDRGTGILLVSHDEPFIAAIGAHAHPIGAPAAEHAA